MRICSLLPSATEIAYAIGAGDSILGVSHECDYPPAAAAKPSLLRPRIDPQAAPAEIDRQVSKIIARGESIYAVDAELLASLSPDLILTQDLCHVCAASPDDLATALARFATPPQVLSLTPRSLAEVWGDVRRVGAATGRIRQAESVAHALEQQVAAIAATASGAPVRPRVVCLEWLDPCYVGGHWIPEMVFHAGGEDVLGRVREPSFRVTADEIQNLRPDVVIVMPCGYNAARAAKEFHASKFAAASQNLPAAQSRRIFAVDANAYFSRPGPRLAEGVALLAHLLHPNLFPASSVTASSFLNL